MKEDLSTIPNELIILSDAYNETILHTNRAWLAAATLTIIAIGATSGHGNSPIPGVELSGYNFYAALTLALSAINLRLCALYSNLCEAQWVLHKYLRDIDASLKLVSKSVTIKEVAHRISGSGYNRIYPLLFAVREDSRERIMNKVKPIFEALYLGTPLVGMIVALARCFSESRSEDVGASGVLLIVVATAFVAIQFVISVTSLNHALGVRKRLSIEFDLK